MIIQRYWRGWITRNRQMVRLRYQGQVEREVGKTFDDLFTIVLRNGNVAAAARDDGLRRARQKQQRKAYLFNVLRAATLAGGLRQILADESARAAMQGGAAHKGDGEDVTEAPAPAAAAPEDLLHPMVRAAIQVQLLQGKRVAEARAAVLPRRDRKPANPGQALVELLTQVRVAAGEGGGL